MSATRMYHLTIVALIFAELHTRRAGLAYARQPVPREWSVLRPWDRHEAASCSPARPACANKHEPAEGFARNDAPPRQRVLRNSALSPLGGIAKSCGGDDGLQLRSAAQEAVPSPPLPPSSCTRSRARQLALHPHPFAVPVQESAAFPEPGGGGGPVSGSVAVSSVGPELLELLRVAVRRLRGLRLCEEGCEEARLTHLVIGAQRRTLKASSRLSSTAYAACLHCIC